MVLSRCRGTAGEVLSVTDVERMKKRIIESILIVLILILCFGAAWRKLEQEQKEEAEREKMGPCYELVVLSPVTGELAYIGEPVKWAVEYAQEMINEEGGVNGIPMKITVQDTEFETEKVLDMERELMSSQRIFLGPVDAPGTAAGAELVLKNGIPNIATYSYEKIRKQTAPYGISYMSDSTEGEIEAVKLWKELNPDIERVVIFASPSESSQMETATLLEEVLTDLGMELLEVIPMDLEQENGMKAVVQALNAKADGYISLVRAEEYGVLVTELRRRGVEEGRRFTASFAGFESNMIEENQDALTDTYIWNKFDAKYQGEEWGQLVNAYKKDHHGKTPDSSVVSDMYNAVMAVKQCMEELELGAEPQDLAQERRQIAEWLYNSPVLEGIQGEYQWIQGKKISSIYYFQFQENGICSSVYP